MALLALLRKHHGGRRNAFANQPPKNGAVVSRKSHHATNLVNLQRSIARHLQRNEPVRPGKAQALAAFLAKEQRSRLGQLQNMRRRGELR